MKSKRMTVTVIVLLLLANVVCGILPVKSMDAAKATKSNPWKFPKTIKIDLASSNMIYGNSYENWHMNFDGNSKEDAEVLDRRKIKVLKVTGKNKVKVKAVKRKSGGEEYSYLNITGIKAGTAKVKIKCTAQFRKYYDPCYSNSKTVWGKKISFTKTIKIKVKDGIVPKLAKKSIKIKSFYEDENHDSAYGRVSISSKGRNNIKKVTATCEDSDSFEVKCSKTEIEITGHKEGSTKVNVVIKTKYPVKGKKTFKYTIDVLCDMTSE